MGLLGIFPLKSSSSISDQWERSGTRNFIAGFTTDCDENYARSNLDPTLIINYPHPTDPGQVVSNISVDQREDLSLYEDPTQPGNTSVANFGVPCFWWDCEISFSPWDLLTHTATGNPVDQPVEISFDWQVFEQAVDFAYDNNGNLVACLNSANDPFDPPVVREQLKGILRVAYNSLTFNPATFFVYGNQINSYPWNGFPAYTIKFSPPKMPQRLYSQFLGRNYWRLEAEFCFNPADGGAGWNATPIDRGFRALNNSGVPYKIFDVNGQPTSTPVLLDGSGNILSNPANFKQFNFQIYTSTDFSAAFPNLNNLFG